MRNRAKCKLCNSIIESFHSEDIVSCKCDEITVYGGNSLNCAAKNWNNFMRIDDEGNEIVIKVKETLDDISLTIGENPTKKEYLGMLEALIKSIEDLPTHAMTAPVTHYDLSSALLLVLSIFRSEAKD